MYDGKFFICLIMIYRKFILNVILSIVAILIIFLFIVLPLFYFIPHG